MAQAHYTANRTALLEHARMGRSVPWMDADDKIRMVPPAEIFALYGFDEFGRPLPETKEST